MNNEKPVLFHIVHNSLSVFGEPVSITETFKLVPLLPEELATCDLDAVGIILELSDLSEVILEALRRRRSSTHTTVLCLIIPDGDLPLYHALSLLGQTLRFNPQTFAASREAICDDLKKLFLSVWGNKRYAEALKMRAHRAGLIDSLGMVAHQWRQPINLISMEAINLMIQTEIEEAVPSSSVRESARIISHQAQRMSDILKSVLNLGKTHRARELFSISELFENIHAQWGEQLRTEGIILTLLAAEEEGQIYGYQTDLEEVIVNLISNARDAYGRHEGEHLIRLEARFDDNRFYLSVSDEAGGVPEPLREKIFQPDFSTKTKDEGSGIGLYVARLIIEQEFRGALDLTVTEKGSIFTVTIPRNDLCSLRFID